MNLLSIFAFVRRLHNTFIQYVIQLPIVIILLAAVYLVLTLFVAYLCNGLGKLSAWLLWSILVDQARHPYLAYHLARVLFGISALFIWLHYLFLALWCFKAALKRKMPVLSVVQLIAVTVFVFAAAHYYVALFSNGAAGPYTGIAPVKSGGWDTGDDFDDRLFFVPSFETVVNFIYFSAVTTATVGYGDIVPKSIMAKLLTVGQLGTAFILIVVALGWAIGNAKSVGNDAGEQKE